MRMRLASFFHAYIIPFCALYNSFFAKLVGHGTQFIVPLLTESSNKRTFKESVYGQSQLLALCHRVAAHIPLIIVQGYSSVIKLLLAYRIERARNRLDK